MILKLEVRSLEKTADSFWVSLLALLVLESLANPYDGFIHDARLYTLQALSYLHPGRYRQDLYFLFGSQDAYTVFSPVFAQFIKLFGVNNGTFFFYCISKSIFLGSVLFFFRRFTRDNLLALIAGVLISASDIHYIFFEVNESFLTPRLIGQGLSVLALSFGVAWQSKPLSYGNIISAVFLMSVAALFHPIMSLGVGITMVFLWIFQKEWRGLIAGGAAIGIIACVIYTMKSGNTTFVTFNPLAEFDGIWRKIVFERCPYLFPCEWSRYEWLTISASLLVSMGAFSFLTVNQQRVIVAIVFTTCFAISSSLFFTYMTDLVLPVQLQFWRSFWLLRLINPLICTIWAYNLWRSRSFFKKLAALLVAIPALMGDGGITGYEGLLVIVAIGLVSVPEKFGDNFSIPAQNILIGITTSLILLPLPLILLNFHTYNNLMQWHTAILWCMSVLGPLWPVFIILSLFLILIVSPNIKAQGLVLGVVFLLLGITDINRSFLYSPIKRRAVKDIEKFIAPGSLVLQGNELSVEYIWFNLDSASYWSKIQGAGIVFNRDLALEYKKRKMISKRCNFEKNKGCIFLHCDKFNKGLLTVKDGVVLRLCP